MSSRWLGQETEYALRFSPAGAASPGNIRIYGAFERAIQSLVKTRPADWSFYKRSFFTENGGSFNYEHQPSAPDHGLLEGATPECCSAGELLLYQRAQEELLKRALPLAERDLRESGYPGSLGLLKNCRDAGGALYGAQENYSAIVASGARLWIYRIVGLGLFPVVYGAMVLYWSAMMAFIFVGLVLRGAGALCGLGLRAAVALAALLLPFEGLRRASARMAAAERRLWTRLDRALESPEFAARAARIETAVFFPLLAVAMAPVALLLRLTAFRPAVRLLTAYFASRPVFSGAGALLDDGVFALSEKGAHLKRLTRWSVGANDRALFDSANLMKAFLFAAPNPLNLRPRLLAGAFARQGRLQIGMSDSNRAQYAEHLKFAVTQLLLDALEAGYLESAPRLKHPVRAARALIHDSSLTCRVELCGGGEASALDLQRAYLSAARRFVSESKSPSVERLEVLKVWQSTLELLERNPAELIGRVDWITKRYLIENAGRTLSFHAMKKIDLRYHELGAGYFDALERAGLALQLVSAEDAAAAIKRPSSVPRARLRSRLIRSAAFKGANVTVSWTSARIGGLFERRVIRLDERRKRFNGAPGGSVKG